jgi:hypothetical protein
LSFFCFFLLKSGLASGQCPPKRKLYSVDSVFSKNPIKSNYIAWYNKGNCQPLYLSSNELGETVTRLIKVKDSIFFISDCVGSSLSAQSDKNGYRMGAESINSLWKLQYNPSKKTYKIISLGSNHCLSLNAQNQISVVENVDNVYCEWQPYVVKDPVALAVALGRDNERDFYEFNAKKQEFGLNILQLSQIPEKGLSLPIDSINQNTFKRLNWYNTVTKLPLLTPSGNILFSIQTRLLHIVDSIYAIYNDSYDYLYEYYKEIRTGRGDQEYKNRYWILKYNPNGNCYTIQNAESRSYLGHDSLSVLKVYQSFERSMDVCKWMAFNDLSIESSGLLSLTTSWINRLQEIKNKGYKAFGLKTPEQILEEKKFEDENYVYELIKNNSSNPLITNEQRIKIFKKFFVPEYNKLIASLNQNKSELPHITDYLKQGKAFLAFDFDPALTENGSIDWKSTVKKIFPLMNMKLKGVINVKSDQKINVYNDIDALKAIKKLWYSSSSDYFSNSLKDFGKVFPEYSNCYALYERNKLVDLKVPRIDSVAGYWKHNDSYSVRLSDGLIMQVTSPYTEKYNLDFENAFVEYITRHSIAYWKSGYHCSNNDFPKFLYFYSNDSWENQNQRDNRKKLLEMFKNLYPAQEGLVWLSYSPVDEGGTLFIDLDLFKGYETLSNNTSVTKKEVYQKEKANTPSDIIKKIRNQKFTNNTNGLYTTIWLKPDANETNMGTLFMEQLGCIYRFKYFLKGTTFEVKFETSDCGKRSRDADFYFSSLTIYNNEILILATSINGKRFEFVN